MHKRVEVSTKLQTMLHFQQTLKFSNIPNNPKVSIILKIPKLYTVPKFSKDPKFLKSSPNFPEFPNIQKSMPDLAEPVLNMGEDTFKTRILGNREKLDLAEILEILKK